MATEIKGLGLVAFEAYREAVGGVTYDSKAIPNWDDLSENIKNAWFEAAMQAALYAVEHYRLQYHPNPQQDGIEHDFAMMQTLAT